MRKYKLSQAYELAFTSNCRSIYLTQPIGQRIGRSHQIPSVLEILSFVSRAWPTRSSWSKVIPLLQAKGCHVVAVQNPVTSLADNFAATGAACIAGWPFNC